MKFIIGLLVASLALNGVFALPAGSPSDDAEVINVPRRPFSFDNDDDINSDPDFKEFKGVIDTGSGYPFLQPSPHAFSFNLGFFDSFEDIFRRLHTRLLPIPSFGGAADSGDSSEEGGPLFNPKNGNTTSTVKIVDGHKIEVNETVYGDANNVFKVRLVNIRPVGSDEDVQETDVETKNTNNNPATSAPKHDVLNRNNDDSDERREPLEKKQPDDNEIRNIDDPEVKF